MTKTNTKRALLFSVLSTMLCLAMLVGSTFAWFTDTVTSGANKIVAGNLDVTMEMEDGEGNWVNAEGRILGWVAADGRDQEEILWEPGATYSLPKVRIKNNGTLALKFKVIISGVDGDAKLLEAISFTYGELDVTAEGHLLPGETSVPIIIEGHMDELAGNEYAGLTIDGLGITVIATQDTSEQDGIDDQYDKDTVYPSVSVGDFKQAIKAGGMVILGADMKYDVAANPNIDTTGAKTTILKNVTLNLNGHDFVFDSVEGNKNFAAIYLQSARANLTVNGEGTIDASATTGAYCFHLYGGQLSRPTLTINGGTYKGSPTAVNVEYGTAYINGGFFDCRPAGNVTEDAYRYTLNCVDEKYQKGYAKIIVTGGTFVNFNPADNQAEGPNTNFVKEGYTVVSETKENGDIWYTVVPQ